MAALAAEDTGATEATARSQSDLPAELAEARKADEEEAIIPFHKYFFACLLASSTLTALTVCLWSSMGMGQVAVDLIQNNDWLWYPMTALYCMILAGLLAMDFFRPPHLPNQYCRLWDGDKFVGRGLLLVAFLSFLASCLFMSEVYPSVPLVMAIFLQPFLVGAIRLLPKFRARFRMSNANQLSNESERTRKEKLDQFRALVNAEADAGHFYCGASAAFVVTAVLVLVAWVWWIFAQGNHLAELNQKECRNGWVAPLECASPFTYQGNSYTSCTNVNSDQMWCSHNDVFSGGWSNCIACEDMTHFVMEESNTTVCSGVTPKGHLTMNQEACTDLCNVDSSCNFAVYYDSEGCDEASCVDQDGNSKTRCGLATTCGSTQNTGTILAVYKKTEVITSRLSDKDMDELYIIWSAPLVVAISNIVFALFAATRVFFHSHYVATSNEALEDIDKMTSADRKLEIKSRTNEEKERMLRQLAVFIKLVTCAFVLCIGLLWVAGQLLYADSQVAMMVMGLVGAFFVVFVIFTAITLRRVVLHLWEWLARLRMWNDMRAMARNDWARAVVICPILPFIPMLLGLSLLNQGVRRFRGIYKKMQAEGINSAVYFPTQVVGLNSDGDASSGQEVRNPQSLWVTPKVFRTLADVRTWDWTSIITKCYVLCALFFAYTTFPLILNVFLAWFNKELLEMGLHFSVIVVITFFTGVGAFLLPPVPGLTVYIFGGLMMSSTCPEGFWAGAAINIVLGYFLKLFACAIQQKCIGGMLGKSLWVRQTVGVHTVAIRCIEAEMKQPGWTLGKVAILCGGPDWPTSVLAGMLNLSVVQCEIGTLPIIFFIIPCSLSGSFYMKKGTSEVWDRSANLMLVTSVAFSLVLWAIAAWAIQNQLERNYAELTRPLPQNVDLEWLDFKAAQIKAKLQIRWTDVPKVVRTLYALGAIMQIMVCQAFWWGYAYVFNHFEVSTPIGTLKSWYGDEGIVTLYGVMALATYFVAWFFYIQFSCWKKQTTSGPVKEASKELNKIEAKWKEDWLLMAKTWTPQDNFMLEPRRPPQDDAEPAESLATARSADVPREGNGSVEAA